MREPFAYDATHHILPASNHTNPRQEHEIFAYGGQQESVSGTVNGSASLARNSTSPCHCCAALFTIIYSSKANRDKSQIWDPATITLPAKEQQSRAPLPLPQDYRWHHIEAFTASNSGMNHDLSQMQTIISSLHKTYARVLR